MQGAYSKKHDFCWSWWQLQTFILGLFVSSCTCSPEWSGTLCTERYDDCRNAGPSLCVHGLCIDADRVVSGQVINRLQLALHSTIINLHKDLCFSERSAVQGWCFKLFFLYHNYLPVFLLYSPAHCVHVINTKCRMIIYFFILFFYQPKYQCICESGWEAPAGNPACVADVDECHLPTKPCSANPPVPCYNTQGSFYCGACPAGNI